MFYSGIKKNLDTIVSTYIVPQASLQYKEKLKILMDKPYYFRQDIDLLSDAAFMAYKESLYKKDVLVDKMKNILLLNIKIVLVDNVKASFIVNYLINICLLFTFLFAILFKETALELKRNEPEIDI
jgi:hypothetical protein